MNPSEQLATRFFQGPKVIEELLYQGADPNVKYKQDPILFRIEDGESARLLLSRGADPNAVDQNGYTLLCNAPTFDVFCELLKFGADVNLTTSFGMCPIGACLLKSKTYLEELIKYKPNLNVKSYLGMPIINEAIQNNWQCAEVMIHAGVNVNITDNENRTPLFYCRNNHRIAELLVKKGANVHHQDNHGKTALFFMTENSARVLLDAGADPNAQDHFGQTTIFQNFSPTRLLIEKGANIDHVDANGETPIFVCYNAWSIRLLLENGTNILHRNNKGQRCIDSPYTTTQLKTLFVNLALRYNKIFEYLFLIRMYGKYFIDNKFYRSNSNIVSWLKSARESCEMYELNKNFREDMTATYETWKRLFQEAKYMRNQIVIESCRNYIRRM